MTLDQGACEKHWQFFAQLALLGPATFLERIVPPQTAQTDYRNFNSSNARNFLLLRIFIEVQKAGFAMIGWHQHAGAAARADPKVKPKASEILPLETVIDHQSLCQRKLSEALVLLINFSGTNDPVHYYHLLLIEELRRCDSALREQRQFFSEINTVTERRRVRLLNEIVRVETTIPILANCWYLKGASRRLRDTREIMSFNGQLERALPLATTRERTALSYTYSRGFGEYSGNIHLNPLRPELGIPESRFSISFASCGLLVAALLVRAHALTGIEATGINKGLETPMGAAIPRLRKVFVIGDFVLVDGPRLGEIIAVRSSPLGYLTYHVKYLADRPEQDLGEDWIPEFDVSLYQSRADLTQAFTEFRASLPPLDPPPTGTELEEALRESVRRTWVYGFGDYFRREAVQRSREPQSDFPPVGP